MQLSNGAITVTSTKPQEIENYKRNGYYEVNEAGERISSNSEELEKQNAEFANEIAALKAEKETLETEANAAKAQIAAQAAEIEELKKKAK